MREGWRRSEKAWEGGFEGEVRATWAKRRLGEGAAVTREGEACAPARPTPAAAVVQVDELRPEIEERGEGRREKRVGRREKRVGKVRGGRSMHVCGG